MVVLVLAAISWNFFLLQGIFFQLLILNSFFVYSWTCLLCAGVLSQKGLENLPMVVLVLAAISYPFLSHLIVFLFIGLASTAHSRWAGSPWPTRTLDVMSVILRKKSKQWGQKSFEFESILSLQKCMVQVNNYEIAVNFFYISHNVTWYSVIVHKFTRIYPVCSTYELTKHFV